MGSHTTQLKDVRKGILFFFFNPLDIRPLIWYTVDVVREKVKPMNSPQGVVQMEKSEVYVNEAGHRCVSLGRLTVCEGRTIPVIRKAYGEWRSVWYWHVIKVVSPTEFIVAATDCKVDCDHPITLKKGRIYWNFHYDDNTTARARVCHT